MELFEANMRIFVGFTEVWDVPGREDTTPGEANVEVFRAWGKPTGRRKMTKISRTSRSVDCGYQRFPAAPGGP